MLYASPRAISAADSTLGFDSGASALDQWLHRYALASHRGGGTRIYVTVAAGGEVVGYYALAAGSVLPSQGTVRLRAGLAGRQPVPVAVLARLAVDRGHQNRGLGRSLVRDAMLRVLAAGQEIGIRALIVHAADRAACDWYRRFGFTPAPNDPLHLELLVKDLRASAES